MIATDAPLEHEPPFFGMVRPRINPVLTLRGSANEHAATICDDPRRGGGRIVKITCMSSRGIDRSFVVYTIARARAAGGLNARRRRGPLAWSVVSRAHHDWPAYALRVDPP